jgi:hypothetical protein
MAVLRFNCRGNLLDMLQMSGHKEHPVDFLLSALKRGGLRDERRKEAQVFSTAN